MKKYLLFFILLSCNASQKHNSKVYREALEMVANDLYKVRAYTPAKLYYDTLILMDRNNPKFYSRRGYCQLMLENYDAAKSDFLKTINMKYEGKEITFLNLGMLYNLYGQYDSAIYYYDQSLKINPTDSTALGARKEALLNKSKH